jgi:hypothetical protein
MYRFHNSTVERLHSIRGGPKFDSVQYLAFGEKYFFSAIIYRDIISHITITYRYIIYFFRTFKKSTALYKVHNMGLLYIKQIIRRRTPT